MKNRWRSVNAHFYTVAISVWLGLWTIKISDTFTLSGCDYVAIWLPKVKDYELLALRWRSHYTQFNSHCKLNYCSPNVYLHYRQPMYPFCILVFVSRWFVAPHYPIHYYMHNMSDKKHGHNTLQCFWLAICGIQIQPLFLDQYRLSVPPFLIQLLLLNVHDLP